MWNGASAAGTAHDCIQNAFFSQRARPTSPILWLAAGYQNHLNLPLYRAPLFHCTNDDKNREVRSRERDKVRETEQQSWEHFPTHIFRALTKIDAVAFPAMQVPAASLVGRQKQSSWVDEARIRGRRSCCVCVARSVRVVCVDISTRWGIVSLYIVLVWPS